MDMAGNNQKTITRTLKTAPLSACLAASLLVFGAAFLPTAAEAQSTIPGKKKGVSEIVQAINGPHSKVGMVVLLHYDGTIEHIGVDRGGAVDSYEGPPAGTTNINELLDVDFEIYKKNPNCISCKHGGSYYTICR
jgi:hypothetical protein